MRSDRTFLDFLKTRSWPNFRLRTLMLVVVVISLGLAVEAGRRRRAELRRLERIAQGRRSLVPIHESAALRLRIEASEGRKWIERYEGFKSGRGPLAWAGNGGEEFRLKQLQTEIPYLEAKAKWEDTLAANSVWAADHPAEPWPARPPEPVASPQPVRTGIDLPPAAHVFRPVNPARPPIPSVVKKNQ
jgi:hypothetical protein